MSKVEKSKNILEEWKKHCDWLSSTLNPNEIFDRKAVNEVYYTLKNCFGEEYFILQANTDLSWIHSLISNYNQVGCISAIFEIASIIIYCQKELDETFLSKICELKGNPDNLRSYFQELYTYRLLDRNQIANRKKPIFNNQELEGTCTILNHEFLFECRKLYAPNVEQLNTLCTIIEKFFRCIESMNKGIGLIATIKLKDRNAKSNKDKFIKKIKTFTNEFNFRNDFGIIPYCISDNTGEFSIINYDKIDLLEIESKKDYDILAKIIPPEYEAPHRINIYKFFLYTEFSITQDKATENLINFIKEKKKQHKNSPIKQKIFFFDSEFMPEIRLGLINSEDIINKAKIKNFIESTSSDIVLCITIRNYFGLIPQVKILTFAKEKYYNVCHSLESLKTNFDFVLNSSQSPNYFKLHY